MGDIIFYRDGTELDQMVVRVASGSLPEIQNKIEAVWKSLFPNLPLRIDVVSDKIDSELERESKQADLFLIFSLVAIILFCMGLLGLAAFTAENRIKEIGIRKVLGAHVRDIIWLLSWQFSKPILLSNILAVPIA